MRGAEQKSGRDSGRDDLGVGVGAWRRLRASACRHARTLGGLATVLLGTLAAGPAAAQVPAVSTAPLLRIEAGMHTSAVRRVDSDAAGRFVVTVSEDRTARVWDAASGRLLRVLRVPIGDDNEGRLYAAAISPDGSTVAASGWTTIGGDAGQTVYLFDRATGQLQRRLGAFRSTAGHLAFSPDGRWLAMALGDKQGVRVWDWRAGGAAASDTGYGGSSYGASWSRDGRLVVAAQDGKLRLYRVGANGNAPTLTKLAEVVAANGKLPWSVAFHPDGSRIAVGYDDGGRPDVVDGNRLTPLYTPELELGAGSAAADLFTVAWSQDGRQLAAAGNWAAKGRKLVRIWADAGRGPARDVSTIANTVQHLAPRVGDGWLLAGSDPSWGVVSGDGRWLPRADAPTTDLRGSRAEAFVLGAFATRVQFGSSAFGREPYVFDLVRRTLLPGRIEGGTQADSSSLAVQDWANRSNPSLGGQPLKLMAGETARSLAVVPGAASFVLGADWTMRHFNADRTQLWNRTAPGVTWGLNIPRDRPKLLVAAYGDGTIRWHRISDGEELLALFPHSDRKRWVLWTPSGYYDASPGAEELIGWHVNTFRTAGARITKVLPDTPAARGGVVADTVIEAINEVAVPDMGAVVERVGQTPPGQPVRLTLVKDGRRTTASLVPVVTPDSPLPRIGIQMLNNNVEVLTPDFFPVSRLRSRFYRPDVIDRILDTLDESEALKQADQAANRRQEALPSVAEVLPPVVEVLSGLEVATAAPQLALRVRGRAAADAPVTAWRLRVNGQLVGDARGLGRQDPVGAGGEREIVVPIPAQDSQVQVFAENRHGVSSPATVRVKWTGAAAAQPTTAGNFRIQPKLYVLAVGVASYQHPDIAKLVLPAKDARDFANAMLRQKGRLYREVEVRLLTDAQATADSVGDGLDWLQKQVTQHDVGVVFIAGHGVNDPTQGYTFLPANADPDRLRRTGVPMDEFRKTLVALPGKALFFFDTCHSGNVLGNTRARGAVTDVSGLINELTSAESGVIVFSSSTGRQLSYEDPSWGNGAFTKAVVEGLDGAADFQKNGRITHKMLDLYVSDRVKQLTGGRQSPVTQAPGGVPDFPVAVVK